MEIYEEHENELWEELNGQIEAACTELTSDMDDKTIIMGLCCGLIIAMQAYREAISGRESNDEPELCKFVIDKLKEQEEVWRKLGNALLD